MVNPKSKKRAEARLPDLSVHPSHEIRPDECFDDSIDKTMDRFPTVWYDGCCEYQIYRNETRVDAGQSKAGMLVDFAVGLCTRPLKPDDITDDRWADVVRVDCAHGNGAHVDDYRPRNKEKNYDVVPSDVREDIDAAMVWAIKSVNEVADELVEECEE